MAEQKTHRVTITSTAPGARYIHGVDGVVHIPANGTSEPFEATAAELKEAAKNKQFEIKDAPASDAADADHAEGSDIDNTGTNGIPADLADASQQDGIIVKVDLKAKAEAEGVTIESDANKAAIVAAIVAHRAAATT